MKIPVPLAGLYRLHGSWSSKMILFIKKISFSKDKYCANLVVVHWLLHPPAVGSDCRPLRQGVRGVQGLCRWGGRNTFFGPGLFWGWGALRVGGSNKQTIAQSKNEKEEIVSKFHDIFEARTTPQIVYVMSKSNNLTRSCRKQELTNTSSTARLRQMEVVNEILSIGCTEKTAVYEMLCKLRTAWFKVRPVPVCFDERDKTGKAIKGGRCKFESEHTQICGLTQWKRTKHTQRFLFWNGGRVGEMTWPRTDRGIKKSETFLLTLTHVLL